MLPSALPAVYQKKMITICHQDLGGVLKACPLDFCKRLVHLNLSMNNISIVDGGFECFNLKTLILSDNSIKEIKPSMLLRLPALSVLNLDMN